ncbi:MAG: cyclopropane fatty acyl phospholipid synthase [bacterium]
MSDSSERAARKLLAKADIEIGGSRPWDIQVHDPRLYARVFRFGSLGLGEAYMDGWWDAPAPDQLIDKLISARLQETVRFSFAELLDIAKGYLFNLQSPSRAPEVAEKHYDLGNDLYKAMLDPRLVYTSGYWSGTPAAGNLAEAQEAKLDLICRKIGLTAGDRVLDIGCGFAGFAKYAAEKYGAHVVGITVSREQLALGKEICEGLPVELRFEDYRDVNEPFDHIVSIEMIEAVGAKNFRTYMKVVERCLKPGGFFLLQAIGNNESVIAGDPWITKYIFPNGMLPSAAQLTQAFEGLLMIEDWHNFGPDYDKTLMAWFTNFDKAWPALRGKYGDRFYRMWKYYLLMCAGLFRARQTHVWQIVLSKGGVPGGYKSVR